MDIDWIVLYVYALITIVLFMCALFSGQETIKDKMLMLVMAMMWPAISIVFAVFYILEKLRNYGRKY